MNGVSDPKTASTAIYHGGNLAEARAHYGDPAQGWLDLSTGISPFPYPFTRPADHYFHLLPDRDAVERLYQAARTYYELPADAPLVATPGSQMAIQLLPQLFRDTQAKRVAILSPTYGEHAHCWRMAGFTVTTPDRVERLTDADIAVITRPNNPDGQWIDEDMIRALAGRLSGRGGVLVLDEAFADLDPGRSLTSHAVQHGFLSLRSFGKFFGLAGIRLGFVTGEPVWIKRLRNLLGPWAVPGPAIAIATQALQDRDWIAQARIRLQTARSVLQTLLHRHGLTLLGGTDLYQLASHPEAGALFDHLAHQGIWVRRFPEQPTWLRFGIAADAGMDHLARALNDWKKHNRADCQPPPAHPGSVV